MEIQIKHIFLAFFLLGTLTGFSQRLSDSEEIAKRAKAELAMACTSEGDILAFIQKQGITGDFEFEYVIGEKGKVITLRKLQAENTTIPQQNAFKDYLFKRKFGFKTAKGSQYQFTHVFNFK